MSVKNRLRFSIIALVVIVVVGLSVLHVRSVVEARFEDTFNLASIGAMQVESFILQIVDEQTARRDPPPTTLDEVKRVWIEIVEQDDGLAVLLQKLTGNSPAMVEVLVSGAGDRVLAASIPSRKGQKVRSRPSLEDFNRQPWWSKVEDVLTASRDYEVTNPLGIPGEEEPIFAVRVVLSSVLMRAEILPSLQTLAFASGVSLVLSVLLAILAAKIAFRPLARIGDAIDRISRGELDVQKQGKSGESSEESAVESKLSVLGEQFRGARADREQLQANVDRLLDRLEEAVLLFGPDDKLLMAGRAAQRLLGGRWEWMGSSVDEVFQASSDLGALVQSAVRLNQPVNDRVVTYDRPDAPTMQMVVNVEVIEDFVTHERRGTMVTLRDAGPRRQIESQLDVASRLASISRLTSGAAHEIKNPLNSIALHLEVLKTKLDGAGAETEGEIEVISREITRLDRVVKSFLDFTRPVEPTMTRLDLATLVNDVTALVLPDAERRQVRIGSTYDESPVWIRGDKDLLTQALLNVVVNGVDAMPEGGRLEIATSSTGESRQVVIRDYGSGIPEAIRDKIYNLYFTTKGQGSGIGLAMTFRIVQLHGGTIGFETWPGEGTEFRLTFSSASGEQAANEQGAST